MTNGTLEKDCVTNPEMSNLLMRISRDSFDVVIYSIIEDNSLIYRHFNIDTLASSRLNALENIVYDNPALLCDFRKIHCVIETSDIVLIPSECVSDSDRKLLFDTAFPEKKTEIATDTTATENALILMGIDPELKAFLKRTFHDICISSNLGSLCRYFATKSGLTNKPKMAANIRTGSMDVIVIDGHRLLMANTFHFKNPDDAVYYLLACRKNLGLDPYNDDLSLAGDQSIREKLMPMLRSFIARVIPVIFPPQMFKAGKDAMLAPFDLIVTPLCDCPKKNENYTR